METSSCVGALCGRVTRQEVISKCEVGLGYRRTVYEDYPLGIGDEVVLSRSYILSHLIGIPREVCLVQKDCAQLDGSLSTIFHDGDVPKWCQLYKY